MAKVKITQDISLKGKPVKVGDVIDVDEEQAAELEAHGWGERVEPETTDASTIEKAEAAPTEASRESEPPAAE